MTTPSDRGVFRKLFEDESSFATPMIAALTDQVGSVEWFDWEPEAVRAEIRDRFDADIPQDNLDKIQALVMALTTNQFYVSLESFIAICNALGGDGVDFRTFDPADVEEMSWAVTEVLTNDETQSLPLEQVFGEEIRHYVGVQAQTEGFQELPKPLSLFGVLESKYGQASEMADPELFSAFFTSAKDEVRDVEVTNQQRYRRMLQQLDALPLRSRDEQSWRTYRAKAPA